MPPQAGRGTFYDRVPVLAAVRYALPAALVVVAVVAFALGGQTGFHAGILFLGSAGVVLVANLLFRMGASGERDREQEEDARRFFDEHGHWPDESPGG